MSNFIRAGFHIDRPIPSAQFNELLLDMDQLDWKYNVWKNGGVAAYDSSTGADLAIKEGDLHRDSDPGTLKRLAELLTTPGYQMIDFGYRAAGKVYFARIMHAWDQQNKRRRISFDIEDRIFLPSGVIEYEPENNDTAFESLKLLLARVISHIQPAFGGVDSECDYLGDAHNPSDLRWLVQWGSYFSDSIINQWSKAAVATLLQTANEHIKIKNIGILTFIHPLATNQAWTRRHEIIYSLLMNNPIDNNRLSGHGA